MLIHFHIHYHPHPGQILAISGSAPETGCFGEDQLLDMQYQGDGYWQLPLDVQAPAVLEYRYLVLENGTIHRREWGENHRVRLPDQTDFCTLYDFWQAEPDWKFLYTSAFTDSLLAVENGNRKIAYEADRVVLKVQAPFVAKGQCIGISGNIEAFGNWKEDQALPLISERFPEWSISLKAKNLPETCSYKFVLMDSATGRIVGWEWGEPRSLFTPRCMDRQMLMHSGMGFRYQEAPWKGAGVAIPVFSIRSQDSWGCGDFGDLLKMIDWAASTGQQLIQLLPVNDSTLTETWLDSYPYKAISVYALHPIYASIQKLPKLLDTGQQKKYETLRLELNALPEMDYDRTLRLKWDYLEDLFDQESKKVLVSKAFQRFLDQNKDWLYPYCAFCYLRKQTGSADFRTWGEYANYDTEKIHRMFKGRMKRTLNLYLYVQFLLDSQLKEARNYAHTNNLVLKGDIPIGICRNSVEAWTDPQLFNLEAQMGAPPDAFSTQGQNWGFPTYNWDCMKMEKLDWWKRRFRKMADYFDAYRIDHILGFFRIWEIPIHSSQGLLGQFRPALPLNPDEMLGYGFSFEEETMTQPYLTRNLLRKRFGNSAKQVETDFLIKNKNLFQLKPEVDTQQKIQVLNLDPVLHEGLLSLCNEVLFVRDVEQPECFHPRIAASETEIYQSLDDDQKASFDKLYTDFFYHRNIEFWKKKALEILPELVESTNMLACGEDLGMIPSCVPEVMHSLGILSLEIQRMPKAQGLHFENLNAIPYQSVCSPSTHDMSPIRAWWQEDRETTQQYYQQVLWKKGKAPQDCSAEIAEQILRLHLESPALWVILPWQDWMAMDEKLRRANPLEERINDPSNPHQYWNYRMHLSLEQLLNEKDLNARIRSLVKGSGR